MDLGIKDQVAIVTGGGGGIGAQVCRTLANEGAHVAVVDINLDNARKIADEVKALGAKAIAMAIDVSQPEQAEQMVEKTLAEFGKVDILNNVAGVAMPGYFKDSTKEIWEMEINVCLYGVMNCCKAVMNTMMEQNSGKIVNVSSDSGKAGEKIMVSYSAAKAGIMGFTRSLAKELGRNWINVNAVCPGTTLGTAMTALINEEVEQKWVKQYALRRLGNPEDTANMIVFLSSNQAAWVTGQAISVNGGYFMG
ncbi:MAG: SDR family oxidoreductase [Proteobacteria bacterium]|nr:SDR family oxidoreductase [Pseudomonadota bacterium]